MKIQNISFDDEVKKLSGIVTHIIHVAHDNRGVSAIFRLKREKSKFQAVAEFGTINSHPRIGDIWELAGEHKTDEKYGSQFSVFHAKKVNPSSSTPLPIMLDYLAYNTNFVGIDTYWASKLKKKFRDSLFDGLNKADVHTLISDKKLKMPKIKAQSLIDGWRKNTYEDRLVDFLSSNKLPTSLSGNIIHYLGYNAIELITDNPYLLCLLMPVESVSKTWKKLDKIITKNFNIASNNKKRAVSFVESVLYNAFDVNGHMALPIEHVQSALKDVDIKLDLDKLNRDTGPFKTLHVNKKNNTVQILGHHVIEKTISSLLNKRLYFNSGKVLDRVDDFISSYIENNNIQLNPEQNIAIVNALTKNLSVIHGKAFTGKSTVVNAIIDNMLKHNERFWLISPSFSNEANSLSGGVHAESIHRFISKAHKRNLKQLLSNSVVIIDEAQSIDMLTLYKLLKVVPINSKVCFIGDKYKLSPIGPGNFFTQISTIQNNVITELVKKYSIEENNEFSHLNALLFSQGTVSNLDINHFEIETHAVVSIYDIPDRDHATLSNITANIWFEVDQLRKHSTQIICTSNPVRELINTQIQQVKYHKQDFDKIKVEDKEFYLGDAVIFNKADQYLGVSNGTMGVVNEVFKSPQLFGGRECLLSVEIEGNAIALTKSDIENINLSYAITAYKIQGHRFKNTIILVDNHFLINRSWLYTVINSTEQSLIFIGDRASLTASFNEIDTDLQRYFGTPITLVGEQ
ncbi:MAG: AAA family ATPase [Colwellia sp.]|nr:AAA family ATPase [Colwellia sp.]